MGTGDEGRLRAIATEVTAARGYDLEELTVRSETIGVTQTSLPMRPETQSKNCNFLHRGAPPTGCPARRVA